MHFVIAFDDKLRRDIFNKSNTVLFYISQKDETFNENISNNQFPFGKKINMHKYVKDSTYYKRISVLKKKYFSKSKSLWENLIHTHNISK